MLSQRGYGAKLPQSVAIDIVQCCFREKKKQCRAYRHCFFAALALGDCAHGAGASARTAVQASTGINHIMSVTLRNGTHGTGIRTGATADAGITNNISHDKYTSIRM
jgi:hypothetical protein